MNFNDWLDAERGRLTALASALGVTLGAVSQWRTDGVPLGRMRAVVALTGGEVTLDELVPPAGPDGRPLIDVTTPKPAPAADAMPEETQHEQA